MIHRKKKKDTSICIESLTSMSKLDFSWPDISIFLIYQYFMYIDILLPFQVTAVLLSVIHQTGLLMLAEQCVPSQRPNLNTYCKCTVNYYTA